MAHAHGCLMESAFIPGVTKSPSWQDGAGGSSENLAQCPPENDRQDARKCKGVSGGEERSEAHKLLMRRKLTRSLNFISIAGSRHRIQGFAPTDKMLEPQLQVLTYENTDSKLVPCIRETLRCYPDVFDPILRRRTWCHDYLFGGAASNWGWRDRIK